MIAESTTALRFGRLAGWVFNPGPPEQRERSPRAAFLQLLVFLRDGNTEGALQLLDYRVKDVGVDAYEQPLVVHMAARALKLWAQLKGGPFPFAVTRALQAFLEELDAELQRQDALQEPTEEEVEALRRSYCPRDDAPAVPVSEGEPGEEARCGPSSPGDPLPIDAPPFAVTVSRVIELLECSKGQEPYEAAPRNADHMATACELCMRVMRRGELIVKKSPTSNKRMHAECLREAKDRYQRSQK